MVTVTLTHGDTYDSADTDNVLRMVALHRIEQEQRWTGQTLAHGVLCDGDKLAVLMEEVGEVARELNERRDGSLTDETWDVIRGRMLVELVQVAACATAWAESLL